jgi:hypothetical protein
MALVFMDALDLHIEERIGIEPHAHRLLEMVRPAHLVGALHLGNALTKGASSARALRRQLLGVIEEIRARWRPDHPGQPRIALLQPAARVTPLVLLLMRVG